MMTRQATIFKIIHSSESKFSFEPPVFEKEFLDHQWRSSRGALLLSLAEIGIEVSEFSELVIENHYYLESWPSLKVSLSHHKEYGAALISNQEGILSVGIDIEDQNRMIKEGTHKYFVNGNDSFSGSYLKRWVAKEAAFKAVYPLWKEEKTLVLSDLWINDTSFGYQDSPLGELHWFDLDCGLTGAYALMDGSL